jgi:phosphomannomutase
MAKPNLVISGSGIRGIVYDGLSPDLACRLASSLVGVLGRGKYVLGRDTRPSGVIIRDAVAAGLRGAGGDVVDVGICPTPTIQLAVEHHCARGGIAVTASHNPAEWNALKLISGAGTFLTKEEVDRVVALSRTADIGYAAHDSAGASLSDREACERHASAVLALDCVDPESIRKSAFKVAIDCVNGAGSVMAPDLLGRMGCEVHTLDCEPSGEFRRVPEPLAENLGELSELVRREGADLGFALDPDGDRLAVVDETGSPIGEEYTLVLCADAVLERTKGPVVTNLSTTRAVGDVAADHGVEFHRTPIGEINVVNRMKEVASPIGGEGNGGVILPALHYGRDAMVGIALVLQVLAGRGRPLSGLLAKYSKYAIFKKKVSLGGGLDIEGLKSLLEEEFPGGTFNYDDGIRVDLDQGWLHVRKSGTEPVIRLISETRDIEEARGLVQIVLDRLNRS